MVVAAETGIVPEVALPIVHQGGTSVVAVLRQATGWNVIGVLVWIPLPTDASLMGWGVHCKGQVLQTTRHQMRAYDPPIVWR